MATLKEIQNCQLEILKDVADFCDKHHINYYLAYGTLLGAVRHKGFIPWDDDVDLLMEYSELRVFKKLFIREMSEKYFFQDYETDPGYDFLFPKIRKKGTYMPMEYDTDDRKTHKGVWIDIFPMIPLDVESSQSEKVVIHLFNFQHTLAYYSFLKRQRMSIKNNIRKIPCRIKLWFLSRQIKHYNSIERFQYYLPIINLFWGKYSNETYKSIINTRLLKRSWFTQRKEYPFEMNSFKSVQDSDAFLKLAYGNNYMIPIKTPHIHNYDIVVL